MEKPMTRFAAYTDASIFAVADSADAAITKAREDAGDPTAEFQTARIGDEFAATIEDRGFHPNWHSFDIVNGEIVDTTGAGSE